MDPSLWDDCIVPATRRCCLGRDITSNMSGQTTHAEFRLAFSRNQSLLGLDSIIHPNQHRRPVRVNRGSSPPRCVAIFLTPFPAYRLTYESRIRHTITIPDPRA